MKKLQKYLRERYALTDREIEYVMVFFRGMNDNAEIAKELGNTFLTAKIHITNIYKKFDESHKLAVVLKIIDECKLLPFKIKKPPKSLIENFQKKYNLTYREIDLFLIICQGITANKDIGKKMDIAFKSSINYLMIIYQKTNTHNKLELVIKFIDESQKRSDFFNNIGYSKATSKN